MFIKWDVQQCMIVLIYTYKYMYTKHYTLYACPCTCMSVMSLGWDEIDMCSYDCRSQLSMTWSQRENRR